VWTAIDDSELPLHEERAGVEIQKTAKQERLPPHMPLRTAECLTKAFGPGLPEFRSDCRKPSPKLDEFVVVLPLPPSHGSPPRRDADAAAAVKPGDADHSSDDTPRLHRQHFAQERSGLLNHAGVRIREPANSRSRIAEGLRLIQPRA